MDNNLSAMKTWSHWLFQLNATVMKNKATDFTHEDEPHLIQHIQFHMHRHRHTHVKDPHRSHSSNTNLWGVCLLLPITFILHVFSCRFIFNLLTYFSILKSIFSGDVRSFQIGVSASLNTIFTLEQRTLIIFEEKKTRDEKSGKIENARSAWITAEKKI